MEAQGIDHAGRRVKVEAPIITADEYGTTAVALTISTGTDT